MSSTDVLHLPLRLGYQFGASPQTKHGLRLALLAGPQLDRQFLGYDNYNGKLKTFSTSDGNRITLRRTQTDSARWGASVYLGAQARYFRRGRERAHLNLYLVWGLTALNRYRLEYTLNDESYETRLTARSSAIGFTVTVPIRMASWPKGERNGAK